MGNMTREEMEDEIRKHLDEARELIQLWREITRDKTFCLKEMRDRELRLFLYYLKQIEIGRAR